MFMNFTLLISSLVLSVQFVPQELYFILFYFLILINCFKLVWLFFSSCTYLVSISCPSISLEILQDYEIFNFTFFYVQQGEAKNFYNQEFSSFYD